MTPNAPLSDEELIRTVWACAGDLYVYDYPHVADARMKVVDSYRALASRVAELEGELEEVLQKHWAEGVLEQKLADAQERVKELEQQRIKYGPICLNCGADKPCMTEEEANKHGASIPCTFDPAPRELWDRCKQLEQQHAALRERVMQEAIKVMCPYCNDPAWSNSRAVFSGEVAHISPMTGTRFLCAASKLHQYLAKHALATGAEGVTARNEAE